MQRGCTWNNWTASSWCKLASGNYFHLPCLWIWPDVCACFTQRGKKQEKNNRKKTNESFSRECLSSSIPAVSRGIHTLCWAVSCSSPPQSLPPPGMAPSEAWVPSCSCLAVPLSRQGKGRGTTEPPKCVFVIPLCCAPGTGLNWRGYFGRFVT